MFSTFKERLLLGVYIVLILSIPVGAYLGAQYQTTNSTASEQKPKATVQPASRTATSSARQQLLQASEENLNEAPDPSLFPDSSSPTIATSFGPTLSLKALLEGRPAENQATKLFVGIVEGTLASNPKFLLSFTVDLPESGTNSDLSLAGLSPGTKYTALLKSSAQIATSSAFIMSPTVTNLNDGQSLSMLTGDLNEDNVINATDYSIIQKTYGANPSSSNWNEFADFNKDGVINTFDLAILSKNLGKIGASGAWTSPIPQTATQSGAVSPQGSTGGGYWIWIPKGF